MKTIWLTDIHLDFLGREQVERFAQKVRNEGAEAVLITGDIGQAPSVTRYLRYLAAIVEAPIYFVLGNHDYYHGSIAEVRASIRRLCGEMDELRWLNESGVVELRPGVCLVGHDSWGDGMAASAPAPPRSTAKTTAFRYSWTQPMMAGLGEVAWAARPWLVAGSELLVGRGGRVSSRAVL